jgi:hypothetical protein
MLATGGEAQNRRGVRDKTHHPSLDAFAVDEFGGSAVGGADRVGGVGGVASSQVLNHRDASNQPPPPSQPPPLSPAAEERKSSRALVE